MKSIKTYVLGGIVLFVWGMIVYKLFSTTSSLDNNESFAMHPVGFHQEKVTLVETFEISGDYRDPFLGTTRKKIKKKVKKVEKEVVVFPKIQLMGKISGKKHSVYMIKINNSQYFFKLKEVNEGVKLLEADDKKVTIVYKNAKKEYFFE